jgi:hypothetical protein
VEIDAGELLARMTGIEEQIMATQQQVEQAFRAQNTAIADLATSLRTALDNLAGDIERLSASDVTDAEITAATDRVTQLRTISDGLTRLAARTPEQTAPTDSGPDASTTGDVVSPAPVTGDTTT